MNDSKQGLSLTAKRYARNADAAAAYERLIDSFADWSNDGDGLYQFRLDGVPMIAVLTWSPTRERLAAIEDLPWGPAEAAALPAHICQQLAARTVTAAPRQPGTIRRVVHGPTGAVLRDEEVPES